MKQAISVVPSLVRPLVASVRRSRIGFTLGLVLLGGLTGCVHHVSAPRHQEVYVPAPPAPVVVVQDHYVYYPEFQVYFSSSRREYVYREGRSWVSRPAPRRVPVEVLVASPSVRLDFHDSPARHHATVARQYPKHWSPAGPNDNRGRGNRGGKRGNDRGDRDRN